MKEGKILIKALLRYLILSVIIFLDGFITIFFDKREIVSYQLLVRDIVKEPSEQQQILVKYLEKCHKQVLKEDKNAKTDRQKQKKEIDG